MSHMLAHGVSRASQSFLKTWLKLIVAHRALIVRKLKGLEEFIPYTSVHWEMLEKGVQYCNLLSAAVLLLPKRLAICNS